MKLSASWRTQVAGIVAGFSLILGELCDLFQIAIPNLTNGLFEVASLTAGFGALTMGWFARDDKVSSEEAKATP